MQGAEMESMLKGVRFPEVDLEQILVPCSQCLGVAVGAELTERVRAMNESDFDYAIVLSSSDSRAGVLGLILRAHLEKLVEEKRTLTAEDANIAPIEHAEIDVRASLGLLLHQMGERPAWLVTHEGDAEQYGMYYMVYGLVTRSDLNKHPVRTLVYEVFAKLEIALAELILRSTADHLEWIRRLNEDSQARILGYWELSKLQNVNVGPVAGAMLSDLLNVIAKNEKMRSKLGYESRNSFEDVVGHLPGVRNQVMHPIRPLISDAACCISLENAIRTALVLTEKAMHYHEAEKP